MTRSIGAEIIEQLGEINAKLAEISKLRLEKQSGETMAGAAIISKAFIQPTMENLSANRGLHEDGSADSSAAKAIETKGEITSPTVELQLSSFGEDDPIGWKTWAERSKVTRITAQRRAHNSNRGMPPRKRTKLPVAAKKKVGKVVNHLYEKRPKQFGIRGTLPPKKDLQRFVRWLQVVRIRRKKTKWKQRLMLLCGSIKLLLFSFSIFNLVDKVVLNGDRIVMEQACRFIVKGNGNEFTFVD